MTRKRWQELAVALLILVPLMTLVWLPILTSDTKPWEAGDSIPVEPPSEDRRVQNEAGFSIVSPPNWNVRNHRGIIFLAPKQVFEGRSKAGILVSQGREEPRERDDPQTVEFLGQPVRLTVKRRASTFDDPALTTWTYSFPRGGQWFEVSYFVAESREQIPEMALRYLETLKIFRDE